MCISIASLCIYIYIYILYIFIIFFHNLQDLQETAAMSEVTPFDVKEWLKSFGLEAYKQSFLENGYETKKLCSNLKDEDLDEMNIQNTMHRTIIFNQSNILRTGSEKPSSTPSSGSNSPGKSPNASPLTDFRGNGLIFNSANDTYSTVFDDVTDAKKKKLTFPKSPVGSKKHSVPDISVGKRSKLGKRIKSIPGVQIPSPQRLQPRPKLTKIQLKVIIRDMINRDEIALDEAPYCLEVNIYQ